MSVWVKSKSDRLQTHVDRFSLDYIQLNIRASVNQAAKTGIKLKMKVQNQI